MGELRPAEGSGRLITVEGVEGAGKSTQLRHLARWLTGVGCSVVTSAEPDGTLLGLRVRELLATLPALDPLAETCLFVASRAEHVRCRLRPALAAGALVLCDRYVDSTVAYQGHGRGVDLEAIVALNRIATGGLMPDLTIVLDLDVATGLERVRARRRGAAAPTDDPFEDLGLEFHERVRKGYWAIQSREPVRVHLVDAGRSEALVARDVRLLVAARLGLESEA